MPAELTVRIPALVNEDHYQKALEALGEASIPNPVGVLEQALQFLTPVENRKLRGRALVAVAKLYSHPHHQGNMLQHEDMGGRFATRVGDYRVIYDMDDNHHPVLKKFGHRREIYGKRYTN